jgi:hypothetical protein
VWNELWPLWVAGSALVGGWFDQLFDRWLVGGSGRWVRCQALKNDEVDWSQMSRLPSCLQQQPPLNKNLDKPNAVSIVVFVNWV